MKFENEIYMVVNKSNLAQGGTTKIGADDDLLEIEIQNDYNMGHFRTKCSLSDLIGLLKIWEFDFKTQTPNCFSREPIIILDPNDTENIARRQENQKIDYSLKSSKVEKFLSCWDGSITIQFGEQKYLIAFPAKDLSNDFQSVVKDLKDKSVEFKENVNLRPSLTITGDDCFEKFINLSLETQERLEKRVAESKGKSGNKHKSREKEK